VINDYLNKDDDADEVTCLFHIEINANRETNLFEYSNDLNVYLDIAMEILKEGVSVLGQIGIVEKTLLKGLYKNKLVSSKLVAPVIAKTRPKDLT